MVSLYNPDNSISLDNYTQYIIIIIIIVIHGSLKQFDSILIYMLSLGESIRLSIQLLESSMSQPSLPRTMVSNSIN